MGFRHIRLENWGLQWYSTSSSKCFKSWRSLLECILKSGIWITCSPGSLDNSTSKYNLCSKWSANLWLDFSEVQTFLLHQVVDRRLDQHQCPAAYLPLNQPKHLVPQLLIYCPLIPFLSWQQLPRIQCLVKIQFSQILLFNSSFKHIRMDAACNLGHLTCVVMRWINYPPRVIFMHIEANSLPMKLQLNAFG